MTALKNPEGSLVLVALNRTEGELPVSVRLEGKNVEFTVPGNTIVTALF
jgi:glucosylceramidase